MGRPFKFRKLSEIRPKFQYFRPVGVDPAEVDKMFLNPEEFEALRLRHYENKKQTIAAEEMQISQTTFSRIITTAYAKITKALVEGYGIMLNTPDQPLSEPRTISSDELPQVAFHGFGCINCGFTWEYSAFQEKQAEKGAKLACPECNSGETYRFIKKLTPE